MEVMEVKRMTVITDTYRRGREAGSTRYGGYSYYDTYSLRDTLSITLAPEIATDEAHVHVFI